MSTSSIVKKRQYQLRALLHAQRETPEVRAALELLREMEDEAKSACVTAPLDKVQHYQGRASALADVIKRITQAPTTSTPTE